MFLKLYFCLFFLGIFLSSYAQLITITGKVNDQTTNTGLPGVTIAAGSFGTSTNNSGKFVLVIQKVIIEQYGLTASSIGYQTRNIPFKGSEYLIELLSNVTALKMILISANAESIVQKAFRRIPFNYPNKNIHMTGLVDMVHSAKDSTGYQYFYQNHAIVKIYFPSYESRKVPEIALIDKKDTSIQNPASAFNVRFVGGYTSIPKFDDVHGKSEILQGKVKNYTYQLNGKEWMNGTKVFVVNFFSKKDDNEAGTLYIDTSTYAFVRVAHTKYNIKPAIFIPINQRTTLAEYRKFNDHWILDVLTINSISQHNGFNLNRITSFKSATVDTLNLKPSHYQEVIPAMMEDRMVKRRWKDDYRSGDSLITRTNYDLNDSAKIKFNVPAMITSGKKSFPQKIYETYKDYLTSDNLRLTVGLAKSPFRISGYQPVLLRDVDPIAAYVFSSVFQFRVLKSRELFLEMNNQFNFGIGGISSNEVAYGLTYNFLFDKTGHSVSLSPALDYGITRLSKGKTSYYQQKNLIYGATLTYEISPRIGVFVSDRYYQSLHTANTGLLIQSQAFTIGGGLIFKVKY